MDGSLVGVMKALILGKGGTFCKKKKRKRKKKRKAKHHEESYEVKKKRKEERERRTHLFVLQKLGQMAGNLAKPPRSLPIIGMTSLRRGRRH